MPRPNATQAEIGADVIAMLIHAEQLNPRYMTRVLDVTGLTMDQVRAGIHRRKSAGWEPLQLTDEPTRSHNVAPDETKRRSSGSRTTAPPPDYDRPESKANQSKRRTRPSPTDPAVTELWCTGGEDGVGHFVDERLFLVRSDRPHLRVSKCDPHRLAYQRARHVKVRALESMAEAGIALTLDDDSNLVGVQCKACGRPFVPGDQVHGVAVLEHDQCPAADQ